MDSKQSDDVIPVDALFNQLKRKANILAEIFNNKEFFLKDILIEKILKNKISGEGFDWLEKRIIESKTGLKLISNH